MLDLVAFVPPPSPTIEFVLLESGKVLSVAIRLFLSLSLSVSQSLAHSPHLPHMLADFD